MGDMFSDPSEKKRLELGVDTRKFEIDLFWKRSLFFWGFIGAAFIAYASLYQTKDQPKPWDILLLISCFGLVCSVAWTLANRGSKYWQENWEQKVNKAELVVLGEPFFAKQEKIKRGNSWWLRAQKFSVSKLTIALSDFTTLIWVVLVLRTTFNDCSTTWNVVRYALPLVTLVYLFHMVFSARTFDDSDDKK